MLIGGALPRLALPLLARHGTALMTSVLPYGRCHDRAARRGYL